jgi:hypothetical protein
MTSYKTVSGETKEVEKYYTVGEPEGNSTPVFTADMMKAGEEGPLFYVETEHKAQLAAELLGDLEEFVKGVRWYEKMIGR